jgi:hypothetical protein
MTNDLPRIRIKRFNQKENERFIPYKYFKVKDQVLSETPGILQKLMITFTGAFPVTRVYQNGTVQIQIDIVSERVNILQICPYQGTSG